MILWNIEVRVNWHQSDQWRKHKCQPSKSNCKRWDSGVPSSNLCFKMPNLVLSWEFWLCACLCSGLNDRRKGCFSKRENLSFSS